MGRRGAEVLDGPGDGFAQSSGSVERPVGVAQHFAGQEDEVGFAGGDDGVGLLRLGDHADGGSGDGGFGANAFGERGLEGGADGDFGVGDQSSGRDVDEVDAMGAEVTGEGNRFVDGPAGLRPRRRGRVDPVSGGDADEEGQVGRPDCADCVHDLEEEPGAVVEAAAVGVGALIGERRKEFVQKIAMGGVDLDEIEPCGDGAVGSLGKSADRGLDASLVERLRDRILGCEGDGAWSDGLPSALGG